VLASDSDASVLVSPAAVLDPRLSSGSLAALGRRYDVLGEAGHGAMGNVYKAKDRETGEIVALKMLKPEIASDEAMVARFKNELLFARRITHKNVCRVYEFNRVDGVAYTSMEFVEGESLRSVLNRFGCLPLRKGIGIALQICSGLKEAHAQGIVHRDLKPENVMIDSHGDVKIMDFGITRSMEAITKLTGTMIGTPAYMAPEQVAGKPVDYRTDIYSLGLMLYEVFTGAQAFQAENPVAVALKQMRESPTPPHEVDPAIPIAIERAVLKCLEKDPGKRFQSIAEIEVALRSPGTLAVPTATVNGLTAGPHGEMLAPRVPSSLSAPPHTRVAKSGRSSAWLWCLLGAIFVLGAVSAARSFAIVQSARQLGPPAGVHAPSPPGMALLKPATPRIAATPVAATPATAKLVAAPRSVKSDVRASSVVAPQATALNPPKLDATQIPVAPNKTGGLAGGSPVPPDVQQRANRAFKGMGSATSDGTFVWAGRYMNQDRAQSAAKKMEGLGLPAVVVPRNNFQGQFYIVLIGPFGPNKASNVMDQLKALGLANVHTMKMPPSARGLVPSGNQ
jgi:cell division septation protein DedD